MYILRQLDTVWICHDIELLSTGHGRVSKMVTIILQDTNISSEYPPMRRFSVLLSSGLPKKILFTSPTL
jgi:hypothetical protein